MIHPKKQRDNKVFLDKLGIIHNVYYGQQTAQTLKMTHERTMSLIVRLIAVDSPVWVLADIRSMGQYDVPARFVEMHARTVIPYWKMAIVTSEPRTIGERVSRQLTAMSGRKCQIRYFEREDDAIGWLLVVQDKKSQRPRINEPTK